MGRHLGAARAASLVDGSGITAAYATCRSLRDRSNLPRYTGPWNRGKGPVLLLNENPRPGHVPGLGPAHEGRARLAAPRSCPLTGFGHGIPAPCSVDQTSQHLMTARLPRQGNTVQRRAHTNPFVS